LKSSVSVLISGNMRFFLTVKNNFELI